jgi:hypothetical protein
MLSLRSGGAILSAAVVVGVAIVSSGRSGRGDADAAPEARKGRGLVLAGYVEAPGIDLSRCRARCSSLRLESNPVVHHTELDARGRFEFTGLADTDYCVEIVLRSNPALVVARSEHLRPGASEHVLLADPVRVFGPTGHTDLESE